MSNRTVSSRSFPRQRPVVHCRLSRGWSRRRAGQAPAVLSIVAVGVTAALAPAGPLDPPAGPVAPTHKTLTEVEPRIVINATNTPGNASSLFRITQPGSYYLAGNVTGVSGKMGIEIVVPGGGAGVTIDLMGFELVGVPGSLDGISATVSGARNIAVRNGVVRAWGGDGVDVNLSENNRLTDLRVLGNAGKGINGGAINTITACTAESNGSDGILTFAGSVVADCTANRNAARGIRMAFGGTLTRCAANANGETGLSADQGGTITACTAYQNTGSGIQAAADCTVSDCTARLNGINGIDTGTGSTIRGCTTSFNVVDGIGGGPNTSVTDCAANNNGLNGIRVGSGGTVRGCSARSNAGSGISTASNARVTDCTVILNTGNGISILGSNGLVTGNLCSSNGNGAAIGSGIYTTGNASRIEGNTVSANDFGIFLDGALTANMVVSNRSSNNTTEYSFPPSGNFIGTVITTSAGMNAATNSLVNVAF